MLEGKLSIVLPAYNEGKMIYKARARLAELMGREKIEYEIIFVDDGSKDDTWNAIQDTSETYPGTLGVHLSRNFGKEAAIFAGLSLASGDVAAVMDCDLQHPPETLVSMYNLWKQGYEIIEGVKADRGKEGLLYKGSARIFNRIMSKATGTDMKNSSDFKMMDKKVMDTLLRMPERNTFFRALSSWVGYRSTSVEFEVQEREEGKSKWSKMSLVKYAFTNIVLFTTVPLQFVTFSGIIVLFIGIILGIQTIVKYLSGTAVEGFTTVILLILFIGSIIMISLGLIGYYLAKMYEEIKHRPRFIISKISGITTFNSKIELSDKI
ncbi:MAG: glycosyltransferase family 2 protein [Muricomes sp.]